MTGGRGKTVLVGVDGASFGVLDPLMRKGRMSGLAAMMKAGVHGPLRSMVPMLSPSLWTTIVSGRNPGRHGIYDFLREDFASGTVRFNSAADRRTPTLWNHAGDAGLTVCVVGMLMTYPPETVNGILVSAILGDLSELLRPPAGGAPSFTYPPELAGELRQQIQPLEWSGRKLKGRDRLTAQIADMDRSVAQRIELYRRVQSKGASDLDVIYFPETDMLMHFAWRAIEQGSEQAEGVFAVFERVDAFLREIQSQPGVNVVVVSDHGFRALRKVVSINNLLSQAGLLVYRKPSLVDRLARKAEKTLRLMRRHDATPLAGMEVGSMLEGIRWDRTLAYGFGTTGGTVFLNLRSRSPRGIVEAGAAGDVMRRVSDAMMAFRDPETGEPVFSAVRRKEELFSGPELACAPDLCGVFKEGYGSKQVKDDWFASEVVVSPARGWHGDHAEEGVFVAAGPAFAAGTVPAGATVLDVAPTVLAAAGVPVPADMDGRVLAEVLAPEVMPRAGGSASGDPGSPAAPSPSALTPAQQQGVEDRLKALGYL